MLLNKYEYFHIQDFSPGSLELKMRSWVNLLKWAVIIQVTWMISGCFFQVTEIRLRFNKDHCQLLVFESKRTFDKCNFFDLNQSQRVQNRTIQYGYFWPRLITSCCLWSTSVSDASHFRLHGVGYILIVRPFSNIFDCFWILKIRTQYQCNFDQWK